MQNDALTRAAVLYLLRQLTADNDRRDGQAAVETMDKIALVAGPAFAADLVNYLITAAVQRMTTRT